ncbi:putative methyltransferase-domain-containing protein [Gloeopeniophorella convolvens]|nr:putative methyltransferase-domain-containing protein [Gloeopeniophorella convolvens]
MDPEEILSSSLETLYDYAPITHTSPDGQFTYTLPDPSASGSDWAPQSVVLSIPDTQAEHWSLHASSIWVSALYVADHLSELNLPSESSRTLRLIELGAGAGLPSIVIAKSHPHISVVASDYPDPMLIRTLKENVVRNDVGSNCSVVPHAWGTDPTPLLPPADIILAADTLWNSEVHETFLDTVCAVLARTRDARVHLIAGLHTGRYTLDAFFGATREKGLVAVEAIEREVHGDGRREWSVQRAEDEDERERRRWVIWSVLKWGDPVDDR